MKLAPKNTKSLQTLLVIANLTISSDSDSLQKRVQALYRQSPEGFYEPWTRAPTLLAKKGTFRAQVVRLN